MASSKTKIVYKCTECQFESLKWLGKCPSCSNWNTLVESVEVSKTSKQLPSSTKVFRASDLQHIVEASRLSSSFHEVDRVLGGGLVPGSLVLVGGDPGIGKSTLLLQYLTSLNSKSPIIYVSGEESLSQVHSRCIRLGVDVDRLCFMHSSNLDEVIVESAILEPCAIIIDSIQTMYTSNSASSAGSVSQVRECTNLLMNHAKLSEAQTAVLIIGHVTKDGAIAGPKTLEHMVDTVLYFESDTTSDFRLLRATKNRFGLANELGVFEMSASGLTEVLNPSELFQPSKWDLSTGSAIAASIDGTRPILVEVQSLALKTTYGNPRRSVVGFDYNRLAMILAVIEKYTPVKTSDSDIFVSFAGGFKNTETALDLATALAIVSSITNKRVKERCVILGELSLSGKVRPVSNFESRIAEAEKLGATTIITKVPVSYKSSSKLQIIDVSNLSEALSLSV